MSYVFLVSFLFDFSDTLFTAQCEITIKLRIVCASDVDRDVSGEVVRSILFYGLDARSVLA